MLRENGEGSLHRSHAARASIKKMETKALDNGVDTSGTVGSWESRRCRHGEDQLWPGGESKWIS